ncbi:MAG: ABC transporter permease [Roseburia sp.]|nr:ABC transporter permease [Roseburia sp.]
MKKELIWFQLIAKRLLKNPLFVVTLLLIPALVSGIRLLSGDAEGFLRVAVYAPASPAGATEQKLADYLFSHSGSAVTFYQAESETALREDVMKGYAACGYIIPDGLDQKIRQFNAARTPVLKAIRQKSELRTKIIDELVYSGVYKFMSQELLNQFVDRKMDSDVSQELTELYNSHLGAQAFLEYEMSDGSENKVLSRPDTNYMLLPLRGVAAILLLLAGMAGTLFWYGDSDKNIFAWLDKKEKQRIQLLYFLTPALLAGSSALLSIFLTGISSGILNELLCMSLFLFAATAFCRLFCLVLPRLEWMLAAIPFLAAAHLIICPIFIDLSTMVPIFRYIQKITPVTYYLNSLYSVRNKWLLAAFGVSTALLAMLISFFKSGNFWVNKK